MEQFILVVAALVVLAVVVGLAVFAAGGVAVSAMQRRDVPVSTSRPRRRPVPVEDPPHICPGGCGAQVEFSLYACLSCWKRLPQSRRTAITDAYRSKDWAARGESMRLARLWFRDNPLPT